MPTSATLVVAGLRAWYWIVAVLGLSAELFRATDPVQVAENALGASALPPTWRRAVAACAVRAAGRSGALVVSLVAGYGASVAPSCGHCASASTRRRRCGRWPFFACGPLAALFQVGVRRSRSFLLWLFLALLVRGARGATQLAVPSSSR